MYCSTSGPPLTDDTMSRTVFLSFLLSLLTQGRTTAQGAAQTESGSAKPHFPSLDSAYEAERLMVVRFTDGNAKALVPRGSGAVVLVLPEQPAAVDAAAVSHFSTVTHAFREATFHRPDKERTSAVS